MRVVHVGNYKPDSANGVDKTISGLARHLSESSVDVEIWEMSQFDGVVRMRRENHITIVEIPTLKKLKGYCYWRRGVLDLMRRRASTSDLFHFHSVFLSENIRLARLGLPYVVTPNGGYSAAVLEGRNRAAKALWMQLWERQYLGRARMIHAVSPLEQIELDGLSFGAPVWLIPNGVDDATLGRVAPPPSQARALVYLGRLAVEQKGLDLLLEGYAAATSANDGLPQLVLAGPDFRGGRARLQEQADALGIGARVEFPGPLYGEDKWRVLARAALFLHTSRWEGMPFAVLEAMALGRPALVTPGTNLADLIQSRCAGLVAQPDAGSIAAALCAASHSSPPALDSMGQAAKRVVADNFTWRKIAAQMAEAYALSLRDRRSLERVPIWRNRFGIHNVWLL
jgi:glycosyltransferase involved in cell wall biosynthesis